MKILFVQKMAGISGSELYLMQMLPELKKRGYEVEMLVIFPKELGKIKSFIEHLAKVNIPTHEIYGHSALSPMLLFKLKSVLKKGKYDIVQSNLVHADFWFAMQKMLFFRKMKLISVKHGFDEAYSAKYGNTPTHLRKSLFFWLQKYSGKFANYNVTISKGLFDMYVNGKIVRPNKIRNIYYGLDLSDKELLVKEIVPEERYALIVGRLVKYKGHELLFQAWKKVAAVNPNWKLYVIGTGNYELQLKEVADKLELGDTVKFLGHQSNPHQIIKNSEFTLVTSIWEGFGLVMLESWVHKKPIIAFNVPAMNEIINDESNGLLVKAFDTALLSEKIIKYFQESELAILHGNSGYQKLNSYFTVSRMADEMCEVYQKVLTTAG